jgi:hypothetical protein
MLLCAGAAGYSYGEITKNDDKQDSHLGLLLLAISVLCDAFTPNLQQRFMAPPAKPPPPDKAHPSIGPLAVSQIQNNSGTSNSSTNVCDNMDFCSFILPPGGGGLGISASVLMCNTNDVGFAGTLLFMLLSGHVHDAIGLALMRPHLFGWKSCIDRFPFGSGRLGTHSSHQRSRKNRVYGWILHFHFPNS